MEEISKGTVVYVLGDENIAVIGAQGVVTDTHGDKLYVSPSKRRKDEGLWLKADEVSLTEPITPEEPTEEQEGTNGPAED